MSDDPQVIDTGSNTFTIVVDHYGDARGTRSQFDRSDPSTIDPLINENLQAYHLATDHLAPQLASIRQALQNCWTGGSADTALQILGLLANNAATIGTNAKACHDSFVTFQQSWRSCKSSAAGLYEGIAGSGVHEDNSGAHRVFSTFNNAMQTSMRSMPSQLRYNTPLDQQHASGPGPGPGGGPGGYGPGPGGYGPGPGHYGPGGPGPGGWGPGSPGNGPGNGPGGTPGPGTYQGGNGGYGPGSGLNTGATLSSYTGGGTGPGPGFGGPGPGPGPGFGLTGGAGLSGTAGLSSTAALDAQAGVSGVGAEQASAGRGLLGGRGGAGGDDEDERDRTTWLSEEEGIWDGETTAPPGTIT